LKSLHDVSGVYGLVVACDEVQFPGYVVGHLTGGEPLRAVLPKGKKENKKGFLYLKLTKNLNQAMWMRWQTLRAMESS
jgi:hypothetical protein